MVWLKKKKKNLPNISFFHYPSGAFKRFFCLFVLWFCFILFRFSFERKKNLPNKWVKGFRCHKECKQVHCSLKWNSGTQCLWEVMRTSFTNYHYSPRVKKLSSSLPGAYTSDRVSNSVKQQGIIPLLLELFLHIFPCWYLWSGKGSLNTDEAIWYEYRFSLFFIVWSN